MNTPVGNVMPKLDTPPKRRTIEIELPMEVHPADAGPEATASSPAASVPGQPNNPVVLDVLEPGEESTGEPATVSSTSSAAGTATETAAACPPPASAASQETEPATAPTESLPAGSTTSGSHAFSEDETIRLLMDLASLQEDLERAREQTTSARRHVEIVQEQLSKTLVEKSAVQDQLQRLMAEFENYRRRAEREKTEALERGKQTVLLAMLEVLDNLERALATGRGKGGHSPIFWPGLNSFNARLWTVYPALASSRFRPLVKLLTLRFTRQLPRTQQTSTNPIPSWLNSSAGTSSVIGCCARQWYG
ncbi:nucleotide exchange factor GrpE [Chloracidobacterium thermophilum]|nr:nucleotide exchange factor GrpE [Chloracidobacterium thermophilum]QUV78092.1 nucleotide exchange factor GrpE [Chloracidobacterium thermophilum]